MKRPGVRRLFRFPTRTPAEIGDEVADEIRFHLETRIEALVAAGLPDTEARMQAMREFGDPRCMEDAVIHQRRIERRRRVTRWLDDLRQDLRHSRRSLRRTPGFTATAVLIVALGTGATTALFSVLEAVLLRPLPYPDANRLVQIWSSRTVSGESRMAVTLPDYREMRDRTRSFEAVGAFTGSAFIVSDDTRTEFMQGVSMTADMWRVLGVPPLLGRTFASADQEWGRHRVAVISEGLWKRRFGGARDVVGKQLQVRPQSLTIVGVMPSSFSIAGLPSDLWVPLAFPPGSVMDTRRNRFVSVLGRLRPDVMLEQARGDLDAIARRLAGEEPQFNAGLGVTVDRWQEAIVGDARTTLLVLFGAAAFVMLIACANLANLFIARAATRREELRERVTLGATRGRLIRQMLTEVLALVAIGGAGGIALATFLVDGIPKLGPVGLPRMGEVTIDGAVIMFAVGVMAVTTVVFGLWPARRATGTVNLARVQSGSRVIAGARMHQRSRRTLIVAEVSLSLVLLIGASLLIVSLRRLQQVDPGFDQGHLFTATVSRFRPDGRDLFVQQLVEQISAIPGVRAAAAVTSLPLGGGGWGKQFNADALPPPRSMADVPNINYHHVTPDYFAAMGATIRRGRAFTKDDRANQPLVAIVNETLARRIWPGTDPIGQHISLYPPESLAPHLLPLPDGRTTFPRLTVAGVVGDFRDEGLDRAARPSVFVPLAQGTQAAAGDQLQPFHYIVVRTAGEPLAITSAIEEAARRLDRNAAVADVRPMDSRVSDSMARRRVAMLLLGGFAAVALLLSVVGLYGVMAYTVSQRREELGVRAAVGATAGSLLRLVMEDGLRMTAAGTAIGLPGAAVLSNALQSQLFEVRALDPAIYAAMSAMLVSVAAAACLVPAVRAARVDPVTVLRRQ
jgi:predicted permease